MMMMTIINVSKFLRKNALNFVCANTMIEQDNHQKYNIVYRDTRREDQKRDK